MYRVKFVTIVFGLRLLLIERLKPFVNCKNAFCVNARRLCKSARFYIATFWSCSKSCSDFKDFVRRDYISAHYFLFIYSLFLIVK